MRKGWTETTLGDVVELGKGGAWGADEIEPNRVEAICLRGTDLADLINKKHPEAPVRWLTPTELKKAVCAPNMVLIETSGSKCGRSVVLTSEMLSGFALPVVYSNFCRTLRIDTRLLSSRYVEMWFSHMYEAGVIPSYRATSAMPNLDVKSLLRMETIAVPPMVEQKRIVDVVSSVDAYIDALQQQADTARTARNAVLHELLSAGGDDWTETTLGEIISLEYGKPLKAENRDGKGFPVFGSAGEVGLHSQPLVNDAPVIIVGRKGTAGAVWWSDLPCSVIDTAYFVVRKIETEVRFLYFALGFLDLPSITAQTGVPGLNRERAYSCKLLLPPLSEQKRIVEIVSSMDDVIQSTEKAVVDAKNLRSGLLSDLLSGEHEIPMSYDKFLKAA